MNKLEHIKSKGDSAMRKFLTKTIVLSAILLFTHSLSASYDPSTGRFLSKDPIQEEGGLNLYAYCLNDPINHWDLLGLHAYVINMNGLFGHTSFAIDKPTGGVRVYHYYAHSQRAGASSIQSLHKFRGWKALFNDDVCFWYEDRPRGVIEYLESGITAGATFNVTSIALGTKEEDAQMLFELNSYLTGREAPSEHYYSIIAGVQCHSVSFQFFNNYLGASSHTTTYELEDPIVDFGMPNLIHITNDYWNEMNNNILDDLLNPTPPTPPNPTAPTP